MIVKNSVFVNSEFLNLLYSDDTVFPGGPRIRHRSLVHLTTWWNTRYFCCTFATTRPILDLNSTAYRKIYAGVSRERKQVNMAWCYGHPKIGGVRPNSRQDFTAWICRLGMHQRIILKQTRTSRTFFEISEASC